MGNELITNLEIARDRIEELEGAIDEVLQTGILEEESPTILDEAMKNALANMATVRWLTNQ